MQEYLKRQNSPNQQTLLWRLKQYFSIAIKLQKKKQLTMCPLAIKVVDLAFSESKFLADKDWALPSFNFPNFFN